MPRLSKYQRTVLEMVAASCEPVREIGCSETRVIPLYVGHIPDAYFYNDTERSKFLLNLEKRGFIRIERRSFIYITDMGKEVLNG